MVVFPVVKLATLALRTACKPIANRLKKEAGYHPKFRNFIISIAQANHRLTTRVQRRIYGHATDVAIHPLNEEKAVQAAADLLGELFVFSTNVADAILIAVADILKTLMLQPKTSAECLWTFQLTPMKHLKPIYEQLSKLLCVAGAAIIFEVQRSSRSEARKEELRRQEIQEIKTKNEELAREIELLAQKLEELEQLSRGRGLLGTLNFRHTRVSEDRKSN
ncbi:Optic atrophy 3 [Glycine max]|nr:Optic atrophy 3 [Glycine max]